MIKPVETIPLSELVDVRYVYELATPSHNAPSKSTLRQIKGYVDRDGQLYRVDRHGNFHKRTVTNSTDGRKTYRFCIDGELFTIAILQHKVDAAFRAKGSSIPASSAEQTTSAKWGYILIDSDGDIEVANASFDSERDALAAVQEEIQDKLMDGFPDYTGNVFKTTGKTVTVAPRFNYE